MFFKVSFCKIWLCSISFLTISQSLKTSQLTNSSQLKFKFILLFTNLVTAGGHSSNWLLHFGMVMVGTRERTSSGCPRWATDSGIVWREIWIVNCITGTRGGKNAVYFPCLPAWCVKDYTAFPLGVGTITFPTEAGRHGFSCNGGFTLSR